MSRGKDEWPGGVLPLALCFLIAGCDRNADPKRGSTVADESSNIGCIRFEEVTSAAGVVFEHRNGATGEWYFPEIMGSGGMFFDYDGDDDVDIYLVQGGPLPFDPEAAPRNRLYRQEAEHTFVDVTDECGAGDTGYGMGCTAGDIEGDGDLDLFVTNYGHNVLYENRGDGTFVDMSAARGVAGGDEEWSTSAAFLDYDGDGDLDLYVVNYVEFTVRRNKKCFDHGHRDYCSPGEYPPAQDRLYRNDGQGHFEDVSREAGIVAPNGKGLGIAVCDFDGDGDLDVYIANDGTQNHLYVNQSGRFEEDGFLSGVGMSEDGAVEAGMGVDFGDYDGDGLFDIVVTNLDYETNTLYHNEGSGFFSDNTSGVGLFEPSMGQVGFGTGFCDFDLDGHLDLLVANGHVLASIESHSHLRYGQVDQVFQGDGASFTDVSGGAGPYFLSREVSRGFAWADYDADGDPDVLVTCNEGPARLLRNVSERRGQWIGLQVRSEGANRFGVGCRVEVSAGGRTFVREIRSGSSYLCQSQMVAHFGLGDVASIDSVTVAWPDGHRDAYGALEVGRYHTLSPSAATSTR